MMLSFLQQVFDLLVTPTGSLTYHLVLAFSTAAALQMVLVQRWDGQNPQVRRVALGLGLLLLMQMGLFMIAGLALQGIIDSEAWLPLLDRAFMLLSLTLMIWLWAFAEPSANGDIAALLFGLAALIVILAAGVWWADQGPGVEFNLTWPDILIQVTALVIIVAGGLYLAVRRPAGWGYGFAALALFGLGHVLYLLLPAQQGNYASAVWLAQMAAFPLVLMLPQRLAAPSSSILAGALPGAAALGGLPASGPGGAGRPYADPAFLQIMHRLLAEGGQERGGRQAAEALARVMQAGACLLFDPPGEDGKLVMQCGYDLNQGKALEGSSVEARSLPLLTSALRSGRARRISSASAGPDLNELARLAGINRAGSLLAVPVLTPDGRLISGVALLAPLSGRDWSAEDQAYLILLAKFLVQFLQRSQDMARMSTQLSQVQQMSRMTQDQAAQAGEERQKLRDQMAVLQENARRDQEQLTGLARAQSAYAAAQEIIAQLEEEKGRLEIAVRQAAQSAVQEKQMTGELRLAMEEIAEMRQALNTAESKLAGFEAAQAGGKMSDERIGLIVAIAQDLRQPLASAVGYVDFLLSEQVGSLSAKQRKYVERIRISAERMGRMVDDLVQATVVDNSLAVLSIQPVDLSAVVYAAISQTNPHLHEKKVGLQVELPPEIPPVGADREALRNILAQLLQNAGMATPSGKDVSLTARLEDSGEGKESYILMQISDQGGGISPEDLPRVFSPRSAHLSIGGLGQPGIDLPNLKSTVEMMGGRVWVDTISGQGAAFSVLLPIYQAAPGNGSGAEGVQEGAA